MNSKPAATVSSPVSGKSAQTLGVDAPVASHNAPVHGWPTWVTTLILGLLCITATVSLVVGLRQGLRSGIDFQWSGARLLSEHVDPWKTFLEGDPNHRIILGQQPNYLHELYLLLLPFGKMTFSSARVVWCGANVVFLGLSLLFTVKLYHLSTRNALIMTTLLLSSAPLRVSLANGQQSLFTLCCFAVAFTTTSSARRGAALGLGLAKYSFAPVVVLIDVIRTRWLSLFCVGVPILIGLFIAWYMTGTPLAVLATEPFRSAQISVSPGYGDVMTGLQLLLEHSDLQADRTFRLTSIVGFAAAIAFATLISLRRLDRDFELALIATTTLFCFKHLIYDYVFLLFPLATLLRLGQSGPRVRGIQITKAGWVGMFYLLFGGTVQSRLHRLSATLFVFSNAVALLLIAYVILIHSRHASSPTDPSACEIGIAPTEFDLST